MARYSKEKEYEFRSKIRQILVKKPDSTIMQVKAILDDNGIVLDKNYINRLINKIRVERAYNINHYTFNKIIGDFADEVAELKKKMWNIVDSKDAKYRDKIAATKEIREQASTLIDKMFDGGVFERSLGKIKNDVTITPEDKAEVERVIGLTGLQGIEQKQKYSDEDILEQTDEVAGDK